METFKNSIRLKFGRTPTGVDGGWGQTEFGMLLLKGHDSKWRFPENLLDCRYPSVGFWMKSSDMLTDPVGRDENEDFLLRTDKLTTDN